MNGLIELLGNLIVSYVKRDFEEEEVKVAYVGSPTAVFIEDDYVELIRGSEYILPRWIAQTLQEKERAKLPDEEVDYVTVTRISFNESRSRGQIKFEKLSGYFFSKIRSQITYTMKKYRTVDNLERAHEIAQSITSLVTATKNLYRVRLSKILSLICIQDVNPELLSNLSEEEKYLFTVMRSLLEIFNAKVFEVNRHG